MRLRAVWIVTAAFGVLAGCADPPLPASAQNSRTGDSSSPSRPIAIQLQHLDPELKNQPFSHLLSFEMPHEAVFVSANGLAASIDRDRAHSGRSSLLLKGTKGQLKIKLNSLVGGREFPGEWSLAAAYFYSDKPAKIAVALDKNGQSKIQNTFNLSPGRWVKIGCELDGSNTGPTWPAVVFDVESTGLLWCDDVLLVDDLQWLVGDQEALRAGQWTVRRRGLKFVCEVPGAFRLSVPVFLSDCSADGWRVEEANMMRARFVCVRGGERLTVYSDGRSYWDGQYRPLSGRLQTEPLWAEQHLSPAQVEIPQTMGRVNRQSAGDADNDGYDESRGTYQIVAFGPRLQVELIPRSVALLRPTLEIAGLPPGKALVTVEGALVENVLRLDDGTLLVEVPGRLERPVAVNVRVQ